MTLEELHKRGNVSTKFEIDTAKSILSSLSTLDKGVVLAGGAIRSWYFDLPLRDFDFYTVSNDIQSIDKMFCANMKRIGGADDKYPHNPNPLLISVYQTAIFGRDMQVIQVKDVMETVKSFPFGICQCWMNANGEISYTDEFLDDAQHNALVLRNPLYKNSDAYVHKVVSYFPKFRFFESVAEFEEYKRLL